MKISQKKMESFLDLAGARLSGDWVIVGGSLLPLVGLEHRVTNDIDLAGPSDASQKDTLILMEIAEKLGLPVEAINQAAAYFLSKIPKWRDSIVSIHKGKKATFYRPNTTLFVRLKMARLSETDLEDCLQFMRKFPMETEVAALLTEIKTALKTSKEPRSSRLRKLEKNVAGASRT